MLKPRIGNDFYETPLNLRPKFRKDIKNINTQTVAWFIFDQEFSWNALKNSDIL